MRKDYNVTTKELELIEKGKTVKFFSMVYLDSFTGKIGNKHTLGIKRRKEYHTRYLPIKYSRRWNHWDIQYEDCIWKVIACDNGRCSPICNRCLIKHELTFNQIIQKAAYENG